MAWQTCAESASSPDEGAQTTQTSEAKVPPRARQKTARANGSQTAQRADPAQRQRDREFAAHKQHILTHLASNAFDHSPKGSVDVKCQTIMSLLNDHADYVTTSSCSGRIALFHSIMENDMRASDALGAHTRCTAGEEDVHTVAASDEMLATSHDERARCHMKRGSPHAWGWVFAKHGVLLPDEMLHVVRLVCGEARSAHDVQLDEGKLESWRRGVAGHENDLAYTGEVEQSAWHSLGLRDDAVQAHDEDSKNRSSGGGGNGSRSTCSDGVHRISFAAAEAVESPLPTFGTVTLKMEPFVMHVECRTMPAAKQLLSVAVSESGFRNSGVVPPGRKIMCGIRCATGLGMEVPLVLRGVNYAQSQRDYVWALVELANAKMQANEAKTLLLEQNIRQKLHDHGGAE